MSSFLECAVQVMCQVHPKRSIIIISFIYSFFREGGGGAVFKSIRGHDMRTLYNNFLVN